MPAFLTVVDYKVFVLVVDVGFNEPVLHRAWYPTGIEANAYIREMVQEQGEVPLRDLDNGRFADRFGRQWQLTSGGKTLPEFSEEESIPKPKVKKEVRYYCGRWEKFLKTQGWVPA